MKYIQNWQKYHKINELGNSLVPGYQYTYTTLHEDSLEKITYIGQFKTDSGMEYEMSIIGGLLSKSSLENLGIINFELEPNILNGDKLMYNVFDIEFYPKQEKHHKRYNIVTNKNENYRIMSTIIKFIKEFIEIESIRRDRLIFYFEGTEKSIDDLMADQTIRTKYYSEYMKHQLSDFKVISSGNDVVMYKIFGSGIDKG